MKIIKKIRKFLGLYSSDEFITYLRRGGVEIGHHCTIFDPRSTFIDMTRPWMISIGNYVKITKGCTILAHDYSLSTLRRVYGEWIGEGQLTTINDNCFIGMDSVILMGANIGKNVIVGAGSVVHGRIPDNVVVAGNPARIICTLDEHYNKRKNSTRNEAIQSAMRYIQVYGKDPKPSEMQGFKFLFASRNKKYLEKNGLHFSCSSDDAQDIENWFFKTEGVWPSFDSFLHEVHLEMTNAEGK